MQGTQQHPVLGLNGALTAVFTLVLSRQDLLFVEVTKLQGSAGSISTLSQQNTHSGKHLAHLQGKQICDQTRAMQ